MTLFPSGDFTFHSGLKSWWKVECDALTPEDWATLAQIIADRVGQVSSVEGVPRGGLPLAKALEGVALIHPAGPLLLVDDVFTTGRSINELRRGRLAIGYVVFARSKPPQWIRALWTFDAHV